MAKLTYNPKQIAAIYAKTKRFANATDAYGFIRIDVDMKRKYTRENLEKLLSTLNAVSGFSKGHTETGVRVNENFDLYFVMYSLK